MTVDDPQPSRIRSPATVGALMVACLGAALVAAFAARILRSPFASVVASIQDDSFYYLVPAWRFHTDLVFTFDGIHSTSGFQPLYMLVLAVLAIGFDSFETFVRSSLLLNATLHVTTALLIYSCCLRLLRPFNAARVPAAFAVAVAYLSNMTVFCLMTTAKENALYGVLVAASFLVLVSTRPSQARTNVLVGALAAALVLTRLLPGSLLLAALLFARTAGRSFRRWGWLSLGSIAVLVPWLAYSSWAFGSLMSASGRVKLGPLRHRLASGDILTYLPEMVRAGLEHLWAVLRLSGGDATRFVVTQSTVSGSLGSQPGLATLLPWACGLSLVVWIWSRLRRSPVPGGLAWLGLLCVAVGHFATGMLYAHRGAEIWYTSWYAVELPIAIAVLAPLFLVTFEWPPKPRRWLGPLSLSLACFLALASVPWPKLARPLGGIPPSTRSWPSAILQAAGIARDQVDLEPGSYYGAYNAGLASVVLGGRVVNLDGLANDDIIGRRRSRGWNLLNYLEANRVETIVDVIFPGGFFGKHFAYYRVVDVVPFELLPTPGYYVVQVTDEPFPDLTLEPPSSAEIFYGRPSGSAEACRDRIVSLLDQSEIVLSLRQDYRKLQAWVRLDRQAIGVASKETQWVLEAILDGASLGQWSVNDSRGFDMLLDVSGGRELRLVAVSPILPSAKLDRPRLELCSWRTEVEPTSQAALRAAATEVRR
ncbi:MAG: hypothetical protein K8J08_02730 [Thermoanaerobaculia bacterium]|nr:hypothetical protein [Thermoanaerobaculia bacterium]